MLFHDPSHWRRESGSAELINHLLGIWIVWCVYRHPALWLLWSVPLQTHTHTATRWVRRPPERHHYWGSRLNIQRVHCDWWLLLTTTIHRAKQQHQGQVVLFHPWRSLSLENHWSWCMRVRAIAIMCCLCCCFVFFHALPVETSKSLEITVLFVSRAQRAESNKCFSGWSACVLKYHS